MPDLVVRTKDGRGTITLRSGEDHFTSSGIEDSSSSFDSIAVPASDASQTLIGSINNSNNIKEFDSKVNLALAKSKVTIDTINAKSLIEQNEILKAQLSNSAITAYVLDTQSILLSEVIGELATLNSNITKQIEAIKNNSGSNNVSVNVDTSRLSIANEKIAEGVENQIATNAKLVEKLNQELNKDISIDGKMYSKIELEKKKDTEILKNVKDENETLLNDALELVEDFLTDGFDLAINPIESIMNNIKISLRDEANEIKTKYNLKQSEV
jgi:hypothetical protein